MVNPNHYSWIAPEVVTQHRSTDDKADPPRRPTWWMRRNLTLAAVPESVAIEVVCLGYYELYVNGQQVGDEPLAPSLSRLDRRGFVLKHQISPFLHAGDNCVAFWCSSGWYLPHQFSVHEDATPLLGIRFGGEGAYLPQSAEGWLCRRSNRSVMGPWQWNAFGGEEVDAAAALPDWNRAACDTTDWRPCRSVSAPNIEICERTCPPNRIGEIYAARSVRRLGDAHYEVDFGTCLSGWVDIKFARLREGQKIVFKFYDLPADSDRPKDHSYGQFSVYHACGDGADRFTNKFNYAGFRYLTIDGLERAPELSDMRALLVESALERAADFQCSNELYNKIHALNLHTLRCLNLGGYPVDCPHRERMGYGADGQTALPAYLYLMDSKTFLRKWLTDWCDVYEPETGRISLCAPNIHAQHAPAWGGIVAPLAWHIYTFHGDRGALEQAAPVILGYLRYLQRAVRDGVIRKDLLGSKFHADWVPPGRGMDSGNTPNRPMRELFNSCYLIYLWEIYVKICHVLQQDTHVAEAEACIDTLRQGVHREFYDADAGLYLIPEQAYQAMPLLAGVVPEELQPLIRKKLIDLIEQRNWHMDTGLPGTTLLLDLLTRLEEHEVIARIYNTETYPGWGYMLAQGATAIWEQWNGFWSQIHSCFAGPAAWFHAGLAGIRPDPDAPGFKNVIIKPAMVGDPSSSSDSVAAGLTWVKAHYDSPPGRITSNWELDGDRLTMTVSIPDSATATVYVPAGKASDVAVNGKALEAAEHVSFVKMEGGRAVLRIGSGSYRFESSNKS